MYCIPNSFWCCNNNLTLHCSLFKHRFWSKQKRSIAQYLQTKSSIIQSIKHVLVQTNSSIMQSFQIMFLVQMNNSIIQYFQTPFLVHKQTTPYCSILNHNFESKKITPCCCIFIQTNNHTAVFSNAQVF